MNVGGGLMALNVCESELIVMRWGYEVFIQMRHGICNKDVATLLYTTFQYLFGRKSGTMLEESGRGQGIYFRPYNGLNSQESCESGSQASSVFKAF